MNAKETIKKIFDICQNTPELDSNKDPNAEAQRLDDAVSKINDLCDNYLYDSKNEFEDE